MPSCIRAPPDAETMMTGRCLSMASSIARASFSPTTEPMLPPRKPNSNTASTAGWPPIEPMPQMTASSVDVFWFAARTRSRYFLVSLKFSGSVVDAGSFEERETGLAEALARRDAERIVALRAHAPAAFHLGAIDDLLAGVALDPQPFGDDDLAAARLLFALEPGSHRDLPPRRGG